MMISEERLETLPSEPGVYLMKDSKGGAIYIGKAKNLRKRLRAYFSGKGDQRYTIRFLLSKVADFEYMVTQTEKEALILENTLIKRYRPRYNINLRDDKTYVSLRIDLKEDFPRITIVRRVKKGEARYFGPYSSANSVRETLRLLYKIFPLRTCSNAELKRRTRPCIDFEMKKCLAPCVGFVDKDTYRELINGAILFLEGKDVELLNALKRRMKSAAKGLHFEEAAMVRDQIKAVEKTVERQRVVTHTYLDQDILGVCERDGVLVLQLLFVRDGKLIGGKDFSFQRYEMPLKEVVSSFLVQYFGGDRFIPQEVLLPFSLEDKKALEEWFKEKKGGKVNLLIPRRGDRLGLLQIAERNAKEAMKKKKKMKEDQENLLEELRKVLSLKRMPERIEAIDISNLYGTEATGSLIVFENGRPKKDGYRLFRIKDVKGIDDYGMLSEVVSRRFKRGLGEKALPDLIVVDGGKGHLHTALKALKDIKIEGIDIISIAKRRPTGQAQQVASQKVMRLFGGFTNERRRESEKVDKVYLPKREAPILLDKSSPSYLLLQRIRDEAHRFAISYHRRLRKKKIGSILEEIPGVGRKRRMELLKYFGSLRNIRSASLEELYNVPAMNRRVADSIYRALH